MHKQSISNNNASSPVYTLKQQNIVPIYVIQDHLKSNFNQIQLFIQKQLSTNSITQSKINQTNFLIQKLDSKYKQQLITIQKRIFSNIKTQIQGTVTVVLNKQLSRVLQKILQNESRQKIRQQQLANKIGQLQSRLKYEIAQQNQKYFTKQITRIQSNINKQIQQSINQKYHLLNNNNNNQLINHTNNNNKGNTNNYNQSKKLLKRQQHNQIQSYINNNTIQQYQYTHHHQSNHNNYIQDKQLISQLKIKVQQLQSYRTEFDKIYTDNINSIKYNWKQLATQLLDNKKIINHKHQQLSIDLIKLKNTSEFKSVPQINDQSFKTKILQKFNDFYKLISTLTTKTQFDMLNQRNKSTSNRISDQLTSIKKQFQQNTQYFTFYMNNSNSDNLKQQINRLKSDMIQDKKYNNEIFEQLLSKQIKNKQSIQQITKSIGGLQISNENTQGKVQKIIISMQRINQKIKSLQDLNDIDPFKMKKIHQSLDLDLTFPHIQPTINQPNQLLNINTHQLINNNNTQQINNNNSQQLMNNNSQQITNQSQTINNQNNIRQIKQLKKQIQQLKDQIFIITSQKNINGITQQDDIIQIKKQIKNINKKFDKFKLQSEQTQLNRKPWIILNNQKIKQHSKQPTLQKDSSKKKISIDIGKAGGFMTNNRNSQKNIPYNLLNSTPEQKFEIYEKYRQKYLSDTLKLPQIFKQKLNSQQLSK